MVGEELKLGHVVHLLHTVDLDALVVVDISPLLLGDSKKVFSVQPLDGMDRLARTDLAGQSLRLPVKSCDVTSSDKKGMKTDNKCGIRTCPQALSVDHFECNCMCTGQTRPI